ncbi:MAG: carboxypeptidase regulatory-like domain-containing protein [Anaerolineae bacterium]
MSSATRLRLGLLALAGLLSLGWFASLAQGHVPTSNLQPPTSNLQFGIAFVNSAEMERGNASHPDWPARRDLRYNRALAAGATWDRWPVYWPEIEVAPGVFDYSQHDLAVTADITRGLQLDAVLLTTPHFYGTGGSPTAPAPRLERRPLIPPRIPRDLRGLRDLGGLKTLDGCDSASVETFPPRNLEAPVFDDGTDSLAPGKAINPDNYWARFVYQTVSRYKPGGALAQQQGWPAGVGVRYWEMWNEPDFPCGVVPGFPSGFWNGTPAQYYRLLQVGYLAAKAADPEAVVLLGGLAYFPNPTWFDAFLAALEADPNEDAQAAHGFYFDVLPLHWYSNPRNALDGTRLLAAKLAAHGLAGKPVWVNESGVPTWDDFPGTGQPAPYQATMQEQASYVIQNAALAFYAGVERLFHFQLYDDGQGQAYGLIRNPTHPSQPDVPRPAYTAYQVAATYLLDISPLWHSTLNGMERLAFFSPPDKRVLVLWNTLSVTQTRAIGATGPGGLLVDQAGITQTLTAAGVYTLTLPPATNFNQPETPGVPMIGGKPYILIERDTRPPAAQITLPTISPPTFTVTWRVEDWGTGLQSYQVWHRADGGDWTLWQEGSPPADRRYRAEGSASFDGDSGHTYCFAAWGRDQAGNESAFPPAAPQCTTVIDRGAISGQVRDILDQPVAGATVRVQDEEGGSWEATTDGTGSYRVEDIPLGGSYGVAAEKEGYGAWPARWGVQLVATNTAGVDFNLPPATNAVVNGGFEGPLALEDWDDHPSGKTPPVLSQEALSGAQSVLLGSGFVGAPENSTIGQVIRIPSGVISPTLSFSYRLVTDETALGPGGEPNDWFEVLVFSGPEWAQRHELSIREMWQSADWTHCHFPMDQFAGQEVLLVFNLWQSSAERPTRVYLDEVVVGPAAPLVVKERIHLPLVMARQAKK